MAKSTNNSTGSTSSLADYSDIIEESSEVPAVTNRADHSSSMSEQLAVSLLNHLHSPGLSELSRKRKCASNPPVWHVKKLWWYG